MKEKSRKIIEEKTPKIYYESIGFLLISISIISFLQIGTIGSGLQTFFKLTFGDWYYIIIILLLSYSIYILISHNFISYVSKKAIGTYLLIISILSLSHISIDKYLTLYKGNRIENIWNYLINNISTKEAILGGGIVGGIFYNIFHSLLGQSGVIFISIFLILVSITLIKNKSLKEILSFLYDSISKSYKKVSNFELKLMDNIKNRTKDKRLKIKHLTYINKDYDQELEDRYYNSSIKELENILIHNHINYKLKEKLINHQVTIFKFIITNTEFNLEVICNQINQYINTNTSIYIIENILFIEIINKYSTKIDLKSILENNIYSYNKEMLVLGTLSRDVNNYIDFNSNNNIYIYSENNDEIINLLYNFLLTLRIMFKESDYRIYLLDKNKDLYIYNRDFYNTNIQNSYISLITNLKSEADKRLDLLSYYKVNSIEEYNYSIKDSELSLDPLKSYFILINDFDNISDKTINNDINYLYQISKEIGFYFILINNTIDNNLDFINQLEFLKIIFNTKDEHISYKLIDNYNCINLLPKGDCYIKKNDNLKRIQLPLLSENDIALLFKDV